MCYVDGDIDIGVAKVIWFRDQKSIENNTREYILSKRMWYFVTENRSSSEYFSNEIDFKIEVFCVYIRNET